MITNDKYISKIGNIKWAGIRRKMYFAIKGGQYKPATGQKSLTRQAHRRARKAAPGRRTRTEDREGCRARRGPGYWGRADRAVGASRQRSVGDGAAAGGQPSQ